MTPEGATEDMSDVLKTLLLVMGKPRLEEDGVCPVLCVQQRVVPVHSGKEVDALVPLLKERSKLLISTQPRIAHIKYGQPV